MIWHTLRIEQLKLHKKMEVNTHKRICTNCETNNQCAMQTDFSTVIFCEEHVVKNELKEFHSLQTKYIAEGKFYFGLCSTCDFVNDCNLKSQDSIILNCEHYQ
ncbi:hypothetical protein GYB57_03110 [bacterium]|nr:hypothetical protein [bacterium]